ncbi:MAG: biosynthetic peptidoglycan transglycosylase [Bacteroidia bacterium]
MSKINFYIKKLKTPVLIVAGVFLFSVILFFLLRGIILNKAIEKAQLKFKNNYGFNLSIANSKFTCLNQITFNDLYITPPKGDTLFGSKQIILNLRLLNLISGDINLSKLEMNNSIFNLLKKDGYKNYKPIADKAETDENKILEKENKHYAKEAFRVIKKIFNHVPDYVKLNNFNFNYTEEDDVVNIAFREFLLSNNILNTVAKITENNKEQFWYINGIADPGNMQADVSIKSTNNENLTIPYIEKKYNFILGFNALNLNISKVDFDDDILIINGSAAANNAIINHPKIASKDVILNTSEFKFNIFSGKDYIALDSSSSITYNGFSVYPFLKVKKSDSFYTYWLNLKTDMQPAQNFLNSLPDGLFENIKGMEATGNFSYKLTFMLDEEKPDEMIFDSELKKENLKIVKYGKANLAKLNEDFVHYPIENGKPVRPILVSLYNPDFYILDQISPYLKNAVLTNEDPSFFYHRGFVTDAFRQSIEKNIKTGQFKRGASTISMQLMKNVFLTREKTLARKMEEILLVYILENNYIVSKNRMFEVYLNIIEWGPNVYGIGEASKYYFNKIPSMLTLSESLFLASIIPSPKKFMWRFDNNGVARNWLEKSFRFIATKMINRQFIEPSDTIGLSHLVNVTGPARKLIIKNDSLLLTDSIILNQINQREDD